VPDACESKGDFGFVFANILVAVIEPSLTSYHPLARDRIVEIGAAVLRSVKRTTLFLCVCVRVDNDRNGFRENAMGRSFVRGGAEEQHTRLRRRKINTGIDCRRAAEKAISPRVCS